MAICTISFLIPLLKLAMTKHWQWIQIFFFFSILKFSRFFFPPHESLIFKNATEAHFMPQAEMSFLLSVHVNRAPTEGQRGTHEPWSPYTFVYSTIQCPLQGVTGTEIFIAWVLFWNSPGKEGEERLRGQRNSWSRESWVMKEMDICVAPTADQALCSPLTYLPAAHAVEFPW